MKTSLGAEEVLSLWETGRSASNVEQALLILGTAFPDRSMRVLSALPIGRRDTLLARIRQHWIGDELVACQDCPSCGELLEVRLSCEDIYGLAKSADTIEADSDPEWFSADVSGASLKCRLPNSDDIRSILDETDADAARRHLLARCVDLRDTTKGAERYDEEALGATLLARDPAAEVKLDLTCAACAHRWSVFLDFASFFFQELSHQAKRLAREVHCIARNYGWSEKAILAMPRVRRETYLQLVLE